MQLMIAHFVGKDSNTAAFLQQGSFVANLQGAIEGAMEAEEVEIQPFLCGDLPFLR